MESNAAEKQDGSWQLLLCSCGTYHMSTEELAPSPDLDQSAHSLVQFPRQRQPRMGLSSQGQRNKGPRLPGTWRELKAASCLPAFLSQVAVVKPSSP